MPLSLYLGWTECWMHAVLITSDENPLSGPLMDTNREKKAGLTIDHMVKNNKD